MLAEQNMIVVDDGLFAILDKNAKTIRDFLTPVPQRYNINFANFAYSYTCMEEGCHLLAFGPCHYCSFSLRLVR